MQKYANFVCVVELAMKYCQNTVNSINFLRLPVENDRNNSFTKTVWEVVQVSYSFFTFWNFTLTTRNLRVTDR